MPRRAAQVGGYDQPMKGSDHAQVQSPQPVVAVHDGRNDGLVAGAVLL